MKAYFYDTLYKYFAFYIDPDASVLEISPQHARLIQLFRNQRKAVLLKDRGCAADFRADVLTDLDEIAAWQPDCIILNGNLHYEPDIQRFLATLHEVCQPSTRLLITYYSSLWKPLAQFASWLGWREKMPEQNWLAHEDLDNLLKLADFEPVRRDQRVLLPFYLPGVSAWVNRYLAPLPLFRQLTLVNVLIARPLAVTAAEARPSVSVVVAARNEAGNIEHLITRLPQMGPQDELILVEGHSSDATWETIQIMAQKYAERLPIKIAQQDGEGKGDAIRTGFALATKEILMILDADLTVPPEDLPKFYQALVSDKGEFINGSRLVYPMANKAMRFFNIVGNKFFAAAFSFVLGQRFKDTLCGTKVLRRTDYLKLAAQRSYFGDFDPFGDFDLLFGASRLGLKILEIPIAYKERVYGETNIHRWKHGLLLLRMVIFAARKIKFI